MTRPILSLKRPVNPPTMIRRHLVTGGAEDPRCDVCGKALSSGGSRVWHQTRDGFDADPLRCNKVAEVPHTHRAINRPSTAFKTPAPDLADEPQPFID